MKTEQDKSLENAIYKAQELKRKFPTLNVDVCGTWVWVSGATYNERDRLKSAGLFFNRKKQKWYFPGHGRKGRKGKSMPYEYITFKYGKLTIEGENAA